MADEREERPERRFRRANPKGTFLRLDDRDGLDRYVRDLGLVDTDEELLEVTKAGEGNMNLTLRVITERRSFIVKQARPWVEKFPSIEAPADRALVETAFYETIGTVPSLRDAMPRLLGCDHASKVLVLEDLGEARDFTGLYGGELLSDEDATNLVRYLVELHRVKASDEILSNREMRALNHEHIFRLPLEKNNGLRLDDITHGLSDLARELQDDAAFVDRVHALGDLYLGDGEALLHGDYFPGSWLRTDKGVRIIDPEFCLLGPPAVDVGMFLGHLYLASQPATIRELVIGLYKEHAKPGTEFDALARGFAGVAIMRRLLGVAQLPVPDDVARKAELLDVSRELVLGA